MWPENGDVIMTFPNGARPVNLKAQGILASTNDEEGEEAT
jgi:hypothetical protein